MAIKVTFYNDVNITKNPDFANKALANDNADFGVGGIYFTPDKQLEGASNNTVPKPAHIVQKGYIYTLGSYVCSEEKKDAMALTAPSNGTTNNVYDINDLSYVVTDIVSDPYNKTITAYKQRIELGPVLEGVENNLTRLNNLCGKSKSISIGSHNLTVTISATGELSLSTGNIEDDNITLTYSHNTTTNKEFASGTTFNLSAKNYVLSFRTICEVESASINNTNVLYSADAGSYIKCASYVGGTTTMDKNLVTVTIPTTGWNLTKTNQKSVEYTVSITTKNGKDSNGTQYNGKTYSIKIKVSKIDSTLSLTGKKVTADTNSTTVALTSLFDTSGTHSDLGWVLTGMTKPTNCGSSWGELFTSGSDTCKLGNAYEMTKASETVSCNYSATVSNAHSIYYPVTTKSTSFTVDGGKQWTLNFNTHGGDAVSAQSKYYSNAFSLPTTLTKSKNGTTSYTFKGWYTAETGGTKISSLTPGGTNVTWNNHAATLHAQWTETQDVKYYWYAGWTEPTAANIETIINNTYPTASGSTTNNKAGKTTTSTSGVTMDYTKNTLYNSAAKTNYYVVVPNGQSIYDVLGTNVVSSQFTSHSTFTNHTVYKSTATSRNINAIIIR